MPVLPIGEFALESGATLPGAVVAYEEYGPSDGPVVLCCHGGFSNARASGPDGYWAGLIGPGKAIDTDRWRVLCPNSLGAMFGSTSPLSVDPATGLPYGRTFPPFTFEDASRFHKAFLDGMGVERVDLAIGLSMGACQCLQLAALYPDTIQRVAAFATAARIPVAATAVHNVIINLLELIPDRDTAVRAVFQFSRLYYNHERGIQKKCWDEDPVVRDRQVAAFLWEGLEPRLESWDPASLIVTLRALNTYDLFQKGIERLRCPILAVNFATDPEFDPKWLAELKDRAETHVLDSDWGHLGCVYEIKAMASLLGTWLS